MREIIKIQGSPEITIKKLEELYSDFSEIKKVTTYLNKANFILDEYTIDDTSIDMILENFNGQLVYVAGLKCGCIGAETNATKKLLIKIGFSVEESERLIVNEALKIEFKERANFETVTINNELIFSEKLEKEKSTISYFIHKNIKIDIVNRKVYIQNPQKNSILGLLYLINLFKVNEFEYYIGNKSSLEDSLRVDELFRDYDCEARSVNLIIRNNKFDIICFINEDSQVDVISTVYYEIFKKSFLIVPNKLGTIKSIWNLLKILIFKSSSSIKGNRSFIL